MIIMIITSDSRADDLSPQRHIGSEKRSRLHRGSITIAPGDYLDGDDYQDDFWNFYETRNYHDDNHCHDDNHYHDVYHIDWMIILKYQYSEDHCENFNYYHDRLHGGSLHLRIRVMLLILLIIMKMIIIP